MSIIPDLNQIVSLNRDKKIYDAVHGFIRFNAIECKLINSEPFQRLHSLHQLGIAYIVYPGATHTRFEHSLGTMELATRIFERISSKTFLCDDSTYWLQVIRLAALCHDLGHLPFSHDAEHVILKRGGHEKWTLAFIQSDLLAPVWESMQQLFPERDVVKDIVKMAIGEKKLNEMGEVFEFSALEKVLCQVVTGDFFGADRIDYLLRDAQCTGVSYGLFDHHQMIEMLCMIQQDNELSLGIEEDGIESCEALLLARHFMHQRVYQYSSVKAYRYHLAQFLKSFFAQGDYLKTIDSYLSLSDNEILTSLRASARDPSDPGHLNAIALLKRERRFKAISVKEEIEFSHLTEILKVLNISQDACYLERAPHQTSAYCLDFSVLMRSGGVMPASLLSKISITSKAYHWVYIAPEFESDFRLQIEKIL